MLKVRLETRSGDFVTDVEMPPFIVLPEMVTWGSRFFHLYDKNPDYPTYREGFCYTIVS